ncbi:protein PFC0760c-like [Rhopalosiphum maidis]|uniref:protein PFC0760c-like n=1 Tax=Rhopalosiphum maidis TaxID=43146 RepID=UPI000F002570|nr:protein PFC0760c-like [Rhopalosiphum maidis]
MFPQSVSARKIMILSVALIVTAVASFAGGEPMNTCVLQKNTVVEEYKLSTLEHIFGETLLTESNGNIYVISICRHVPEMYYDARKMTGAIKLTADGNTIDLGHIDQSNIIVNENNIVLTYISGDRDRYTEDTCKGLRWKTYLTFICDPSINYNILTLIDEDPEQPEICQVWFEVKTSKTCNWHPNIPLAVLEKDFSTRENLTTKSEEWRTAHEEYNVKESTNSNKMPLQKNAFDHKIFNSNNNNKSIINENDNNGKENKTNNEDIKNGNLTQIISKAQKKQLDIENKDNYLKTYEKSLLAKIEKEETKGGNSKIYENKMLIDHENNDTYSNNDLENKFTNLKFNNTVSGTSYNNEYSYPRKNETILHYNNLKKYINQNKNSEGKNENSVINKLTKYDQNKDGELNQYVSKMEKNLTRNTFEKKTSNKKMNDFEEDKNSSDNEKKFNQDYSKKSYLNNDTNNKTSNSVNGDKSNTINERKIVDISNQSQSKNNKSIIYDDNKVPGNIVNENQTQIQKKNLESNPFQEVDSKTVIKNNTINGIITPRDESKNKPTDSEDIHVDTNNINVTKHNTSDDDKIIDTNEKNKMKNNYFKPKENGQSNTNESGEVSGSSTELPIDTSTFYESNNIKTNNKSKQNGTIINNINNVNKNIQPEQLEPEPEPSANLSDNNVSDDLKTTENSTNQSENSFSFSKIFGNDSTAKIIGSIVSLISISGAAGVAGTAINRFYYKKTGTDQIPFKGTFRLIKNYITKLFCCCYISGDDLEAQNSTNEKTPLLQPKFNTSSPLVVDEKSQKSKKRNKKSDDEEQQKSDSTDNDDNSQQKSNNEYGSMTNEKKSLAKNVEETLINIENNLQGKSIKDSLCGKMNTILNEKLKPTINGILENVVKKVESNEEVKKNLDIISKDAAMISKLVDKEKSIKITDEKNVEIKPENTNSQLNNDKKQSLNSEENNENDVHNIIEINTNVDVEKSQNKVPLNEIETRNAVVQEHINSKTLGESQQFENVTPVSEVSISKVSVPDLQQIETNEQMSDMKTTSTLDEDTTKKLIENAHNKRDVVTENKIEKLVETVVTPHTETAMKINESKLKFLGFEKEDKNVEKKVVVNKSIVPENNEEDEEEVEVIEEIVYIDGADGAEDEEIIEEIIETTTVEDLPDTLDESGSGHTKVTVHTTRKISSSSLPGEVKTIEETVVTDGVSENEKKSHGFQFGIGKSGVSMSVGDKKLEIGMPKLSRSKSKSPKNVEDDEPDKRDTKSPEKSRKSISMPKIFKRSISQPADHDIPEAEGEPQLDAAPIRKSSQPSAGLLIFGKSRSKSSLILDTVDIDVNTGVVSDFIDNERRASRISNTGLGEFDIAAGDGDVGTTVTVRKTSTTTSKGIDTLPGIDTVVKSTTGLPSGSVKVQQSTKSADTKSNAKTKREKKEKTKLTTLTRPF